MERFKDNGKTIYSFHNELLVSCPRCNSCAIVRRIEPDNTDVFAPRRFSCVVCGSTKD